MCIFGRLSTELLLYPSMVLCEKGAPWGALGLGTMVLCEKGAPWGVRWALAPWGWQTRP